MDHQRHGADVSSNQQVLLAGSGDPYAGNVILLLRGEGANGGTTFTDSGPLNLTLTASGGSFTTSTTQAKFGTSSIKGVGGTGYLRYTNTAATELTGDFTIEGWSYWTGVVVGNQETISFEITSGGALQSLLSGTPANRLLRYWDGTAYAILGTGITNDAWFHWALTRSGTTITLWQSGASKGTVTSSATIGVSGLLTYIGSYGNGSETLNGYVDNIRITKGVARYTSAFTPPGDF